MTMIGLQITVLSEVKWFGRLRVLLLISRYFTYKQNCKGHTRVLAVELLIGLNAGII